MKKPKQCLGNWKKSRLFWCHGHIIYSLCELKMQMYVNYYDRYEKLDEENPTVGILMCKENNDALVEITLPKDANIYASQYNLYLPDKKLLQEKLKQWIAEEES